MKIVYADQTQRRIGDRDHERLPGPQPASLGRAQLETVRARPYAILEKSDGERCMLFASSEYAYLIDRKFTCRAIDHGAYALTLADRGHTLLDGEMIVGRNGALIYLIYDCVQFNGAYVGNRDLPARLQGVHACVDAFARGAAGADAVPFELMCKTFLPKHLVHQHLARISKLADGSYQYTDAAKNICNQNDGLIFTPEDEPYFPSSNQLLLKWKWPDLNSIDFKLIHPYYDRNQNVRMHV